MSSPTWAESDRKGFQGTSSRRYGPQTLAQQCVEGIADRRELGRRLHPPAMSAFVPSPPANRFDSCIPIVAGLIELTV